MFKLIDDLDIKNKKLSNIALLAGFNILDNNTTKPYKLNEEINIDSLIQKDKSTIEDKLFIKFYGMIDTSNKKLTKKREKRLLKRTRKK